MEPRLCGRGGTGAANRTNEQTGWDHGARVRSLAREAHQRSTCSFSNSPPGPRPCPLFRSSPTLLLHYPSTAAAQRFSGSYLQGWAGPPAVHVQMLNMFMDEGGGVWTEERERERAQSLGRHPFQGGRAPLVSGHIANSTRSGRHTDLRKWGPSREPPLRVPGHRLRRPPRHKARARPHRTALQRTTRARRRCRPSQIFLHHHHHHHHRALETCGPLLVPGSWILAWPGLAWSARSVTQTTNSTETSREITCR